MLVYKIDTEKCKAGGPSAQVLYRNCVFILQIRRKIIYLRRNDFCVQATKIGDGREHDKTFLFLYINDI